MPSPVAEYLASLTLTPDTDASSYNRFTATSLYTPRGRIFGGQVLAQAVVAASCKMDPQRPIHSIHGYFLRPGSLHDPVTYQVDALKTGRSFSTSYVSALQDEQPIFSMMASFQEQATGLLHQPTMPRNVPAPETLPTVAEIVDGHQGDLPKWWANDRPLDVRYVEDPVYVEVSQNPTNRQLLWFKSKEALPDDPLIHRATLAYASDYAMFDPIYRLHGLTHNNTALRSASLDHAMWWHHFGRADNWILMELESPAANSARGLTTAHMYSRDGILLASTVQQVMVRLPR